MESQKEEACLWNAIVNGLNCTKKPQSLRPSKNLRNYDFEMEQCREKKAICCLPLVESL